MKLLFSLKNRIEDLFNQHSFLMGYLSRLVISVLALFILRDNIGFNEILSNTLFVAVFALICSFLPFKLMLLSIFAYFVVQVFSLSAGIGIVTSVLLLVSYLLYYRFDEKHGYVILLLPLLCMIRLPILIPLILAVTGTMGSLISIVLAYILYYYLHYLSINTAVIQGLADADEINKMSIVLSRIFSDMELWYTLLCVVIVFLAVYYLKKINVNKSNIMAISIGAGIYLILILISNLLMGSMSYTRLIWIVAGTLISWILAMIISGIVLPLDYNRTELLEFEDDEYKYYVRAVPKASISRESVKIKRIYTRKYSAQTKDKEARS